MRIERGPAYVHRELFCHSWLLVTTGLAVLVGYTLLGKLYWFNIPFYGVLLALVLYGSGIAMSSI